MSSHLLVVDDVPAICEVVKLALEADRHHRVMTAFNAFDAIAAIDLDRYDVAIIDASMPAVNGLTVAQHALARGVPVLLMTGEPLAQQSFTAGSIPFVAKPFHVKDIVEQTRLLLHEARERHAQLTVQMARLAKNLAQLDAALARSRALRRRSQELPHRLRR